MAELTVHIRAIYDEVTECRNELAKVEKQMKNLDSSSSSKEVQRLMTEYNRLYQKWEDGMTRLGKLGAYARNAAEKVSEALGGDAEMIEHIDKASSNMAEKVAKRAKAELDINEALRKQREELVANKAKQEEVYKKAKANFELIQKEYNAKPDSERTADDKLLMNLYEEEYRGVKKVWDEINDKVAVYDSMLKVSADRLEKMTKQILEAHSGFDGIDNSEALSQMRNDANVLIDVLQEASDKVEQIQGEMSSDKGFFSRLFEGSDDIEKTNQQVEEFGKAVNEAFGIANTALNAQQTYVDALTEQMGEYERKIAEASDPKEVEQLQSSFAALKAEQLSALGVLESIKEVMNNLGDDVDNAEGMKAHSDKISALHEKVSKLKELFTHSGAEEMGEDLKELDKEVEYSSDTFSKFYKNAEDSTNSLKNSLKQLATMAGVAFGVREIGSFMGKVMQTREYFQDIESSMKVFLGSAEAGAEFTDKLKDYAYYNMFEFSDLAQASQQMISYGHAAESIIPRLDQLSNVATGTHGSLMELVDAYNRAKATGVVDARGVQSWAVKGVMIRDVLRDMGEQATGTQITFEQLNKVLDKVTGEGGQFHNLMLEMMDNISAEKGQLEDNLSSMYNAIGEQYQDIIVKWYKFQSELVDNYESIGGEVLDLGAKFAEWGIDKLRDNIVSLVGYLKQAIVVFGTWKVTIAALTPLHKLHTWWIGAETTAREINTRGLKYEGIARGQATAAIIRQTQAQKMLSASILASPWTWAAAAITGTVAAIYAYHEGVMTTEKAQKLLNSATEDYNDAVKEQNGVDQENIGIIKDKTKSLLEQTRAYKQLIKDREIFASYSKEEIAKMTPEMINQLQSQDNETKNEERLRNQVEAAKELQKLFASRAFAWSETGEDEDIDKIVEKFKLSADYAEKLKNSIGGWTDLSDWADELVKATGNELQTYLSDSAKDGITEGFKNGFTDSSMQDEAAEMIKNYSNDLILKTAEVEDKILEAQKKVEELERSGSGVGVSKTTAAAVGGTKILTGLAKNSEIMKLNKEIEEFQANLTKTRQEVADTFVKQMQPKVEETKKKLESLNKEYLNATGEKKTEIETKIKDTNNELNTLKSMMHFFEDGVTNKELIVKITEDVNDSILGDEKLTEIGKAYEDIETMALKFVEGIDNAREEMSAFTDISVEDAQRIAEKYGVTAEDVAMAFGSSFDNIQKQIDELNKELDKTTDPNKKRQISLDIAEKEKQLKYISDIRTQLEEAVKDPYTLHVNIVGKAEKWVKELLRDAGYDIPETNETTDKWGGVDFAERGLKKMGFSTQAQQQRQNSKKAQEKGKAAAERNKPENKPDTYTGSEWESKDSKAKQTRIKELQQQLKGKLTREEYDKAKKELDSLTKGNRNNKNERDILQRRQRDYDMFLKNREQQQKQEIDSLNAYEEARIAGIENATKREEAERKNRFRLAEQSVKEQEEAFKKANVEQIKAEWQNKKENKDKIWADTKTAQDVKANGYANIALTELQQAQIDAMREKNFQEEKRYQREIQEAQLTELYDYLKEYGTFQEAKYAITKEYAKKIAEAEAAGDNIRAKKLKAERDKNLSGAKARELSQGIDFSQISYGLSDVMDGIMRETLQRIRDYRVTDEYKSSSPESKKAIADLEKQLLDKGAGGSISPFGSWAEINKHAEEFDKAIIRTTKAQKMHEIASKNLAAQEEMLKKKRNDPKASQIEIKIQEGIVDAAKKAFEQTGEELKDAKADQDDAGQQVQSDLTEVEKGLQDFNTILGQITSGSLSGFADGVANLVTKITNGGDAAMKGLAGLSKAGGIISAILAVIDALGDKPVEFIDELFNKIVNAINAILQNLPEIIASIIKGVGELIGGIFGSIGSWFGIDFGSSNKARIEEENNKLANATMVNTEAINRLTEEMKKVNPAEAYNNYMLALQKMQQNEENAKRTMHNNAEMYDGGHSLWSDYWDNGGGELTKQIYQALGKKYTDQGLATMVESFSAADWNRLLKERPDLMTKLGEAISNAEDENNYNGMFQDILDFANEFSEETYEGLRRAFQDAVTYLSFDSMYSSFVSSLMDMDKKAQDFTQDFEGYLRNAIYQAMAADALKPLLEDWYDAFAHAMKSKEDNDQYLSDEEIQSLMSTGGTYTDEEGNTKTFKSISNIEDTAIQMRNGIEQLGLYNGKNGYNQTATGKSIENISYTQADSLVGIGTAQQIALEQSRDRLDMLNAKADQMYMTNIEVRDIAADSRDILAGMAIHVEEIRDGMVDTVVPAIKDMSSELTKVRKALEEQ